MGLEDEGSGSGTKSMWQAASKLSTGLVQDSEALACIRMSLPRVRE